MKINELKLGIGNVSIEGKVIDISETRDVQTKYGKRSVADALIEDETGQITLSLWQDQINRVSIGDKVNISGAFITQFRDELRLSIPRSGKIEVIKE